MPQKALLAALLLCAASARADEGSADAGLYGDYRLELSDRDQLALWGSYDGSDAVLELGCRWTREGIELSLAFANVFDGEPEPGVPRSLVARVKYSF